MERKRKLPARASARVENANKRRSIPSRERSETPPPPPPPVVKEPTPPPPLPNSIQTGKPLPTVEDPQPENLSTGEYQTISESGVLAESLSRSRQRWISQGLFEKYWTKPHKRKGVVNEDPKNPPKDSMTKVGTVTITIEPHVMEATMFAVKESKLRHPPPQQLLPQNQVQSQQPVVRPVLQYGPPNGSMPPPPTPTSATATPTSATATPKPVAAPSPTPSSSLPSPKLPQQHPVPTIDGQKGSVIPLVTNHATHLSSPNPSYPARTAAPTLAPPSVASPPVARSPSNPPQGLSRPPPPPTTAATRPLASAAPAQNSGITKTGPPGTGHPPPAAKPAPNDPVIALLAQKASGDAELRDLMKRVAVGQAKDGELAHFQKIIDQLNAEYRRSGGQQGPSADRLLVDGRTVKYFADEVRTILDIVLASNPQQKSSELRPPPRSDPLVVLLVKAALEDTKTKDMIKRIAEGRPGYTDATDLKDILDKLHRDAKPVPQSIPAPQPAKPQQAGGLANGHPKPANLQMSQPPNSQTGRSKWPSSLSKPDLSAVVFDFGSGDRYLFPKFSILEYLPTSSGQELVASFLIVRKGSTSEYGGDPKLDYYQPVSIRISTPTGRHLENIARVVAPQDEVRRYMDDVMDNMTRAEYVLLAMRLPRATKEEKEDGLSDELKTNGSTPKAEADQEQHTDKKLSVLWNTNTSSTKSPLEIYKASDQTEAEVRYDRFIRSVSARGA